MKIFRTAQEVEELDPSDPYDQQILSDIQFVESNLGEYSVLRDLYFDGNEWSHENPPDRWDERIPEGSKLILQEIYPRNRWNYVPDVGVQLLEPSNSKLNGFDMSLTNVIGLLKSNSDLIKA